MQNGSFTTKPAKGVAVHGFKVVCLTNEFIGTGYCVTSTFASFCPSRKRVAEKKDICHRPTIRYHSTFRIIILQYGTTQTLENMTLHVSSDRRKKYYTNPFISLCYHTKIS